MTQTNNSIIRSLRSEKGSTFFYILLGVVLFGTLAFTVSRSMKGQQASTLNKRKISLAVSEILARTQVLDRGMDRLRRNNVSESDLCFTNSLNSGTNNTAYANAAGCADDGNKFYHPDGGDIRFQAIPEEWLDPANAARQGYGEWMFTTSNAVIGFGPLNTDSSVELVAHINHLKEDVCRALNAKLGINGIPANGTNFDPTAPTEGTFSADAAISVAALSGRTSGCFVNNTDWRSAIFYHVLIQR